SWDVDDAVSADGRKYDLKLDADDLSIIKREESSSSSSEFKVTEVLADLILMAPPEDQGMMIADVLRNLGQFVLEKNGDVEDEGQSGRRRH
ncbi:MAG: hypothetical protein WAK69_19975, partial [Rhodoplanes sp.]